MDYFKSYVVLAAATVASLGAVSAQAGVIIEGTRVIYPAHQRQVSVNLSNEDRLPRLVQVWIDGGNEKLAPEQADVPFNVTPPLFRMEAGASQSLRVVYTGEPLPTNKESVFWLNVLEVPPKPASAADKNTLQFAFRIRIKVFFRPDDLPGSATDAPRQLTWTLVKSGPQHALEVRNPTAYFVSFQNVALALEGKLVKGDDAGGHEANMVAPGGTLRFPLKENVSALPRKAEVRFSTINDYGGFVPASMPLGPAG